MSDALAMEQRTQTQRNGRTRQPHWNKGRHAAASAHDGANGGGNGGGGGRHHAHRRATRSHTSPTGVHESGFSPQRQGGGGGGGGGGRRRGGQYRRHNYHHRRRDHERHMNTAPVAAAAVVHDGGTIWSNQLPDYHVFDVFGNKGLMLIKGSVPVQDLAQMGLVLPLPWMHPDHHQPAQQQHNNYPAANCYPMHHPPIALRNESPYSATAPPYIPKSYGHQPTIPHVPRATVPMHIGVPPVHSTHVDKPPTQHVTPPSAALDIVPPPNNSASPDPASEDKDPKKADGTPCNVRNPTTKKPACSQTTPAVSNNGLPDTQNDVLVHPPRDAIESRDSNSAKLLAGETPKAEVVPNNTPIAESITHVVSKKSSASASSNPKVSVKSDGTAIAAASSIPVAPSQCHDAPSAPSVSPPPGVNMAASTVSIPPLTEKTATAAATGSYVDVDAKSAKISVSPCNQSSNGGNEVVSSQTVQPSQATAEKKPPIPTSTTPIDSSSFVLPLESENINSKVPPASSAADKPLFPKKAKASVLLPIPIVSPNKMPTPTTTTSLKKKPSSRAAGGPAWQKKALESASFIATSSANKPPAPAASPRQSLAIVTIVRSTK